MEIETHILCVYKYICMCLYTHTHSYIQTSGNYSHLDSEQKEDLEEISWGKIG